MFSSWPGKDRKQQKGTAVKPSHLISVITDSTWAIWVDVSGVGGAYLYALMTQSWTTDGKIFPFCDWKIQFAPMVTHILAPAQWCNQKRMMAWCPGWRRPKSQTLLQVDISQLTDAIFYIGYARHWSVAVKLYGQIIVLQKTGWVQQLCPPRSSFSAPLPSQRISCRWEPSSSPLLQSEQHVPQRNETARPTGKKT